MKSLLESLFARFGKTERALIGISMIGLLFTGGYFFLYNSTPRSVSVKSGSFGVIKPMGQDVRVRGEQDDNWNHVQRDANVFRNDRLYTGATSSALISLKSKQKFTVEPNSLIVLSDQEDSIDLNIGSGGFLGELKKGVRLLVTSGNTKTEIQGDGGIIKLNAGEKNELKLVVLRGEAQVKNNQGEVQKISSEHEVKISETEFQVKKLDIAISTPAPGTILWNQEKPVEFSWTLNTPDKQGPVPVNLEISKDPLFKSHVKTLKVSDLKTQVLLPADGVYFWRLSATDKHEEASSVSSFSYYKLQAPVISKEASIETTSNWKGEALDPISFAWNDPAFSDSYELQISKDVSFSQILYSEKTSEGSLDVGHLAFGEYFWRVTSRQETRADLTSEVGHILIKSNEPLRKLAAAEPAVTAPEVPPAPPVEKVVKPKSLERPEPLKAEYAFELIEGDQKKENPPKGFTLTEKPEISWNPVEGAESYDIELSQFDDFSQLETKATIKDTRFIWEKPMPGQFFVRLRANRGSEMSSDANIKLRIILMTPSLQALKLSSLPNEAPNLSATWKDHHLSKKTEIQISRTINFEKPTSVKSTKGNFTEVVTEPGMYFVRVRSLNDSDWPVSRFSNVEKIEVLTWLPPEDFLAKEPVLVAPTLTHYQVPRMSIWGGLGADYLVFKQAGAADVESGTFSSVATPSIFVGANVRLTDRSSFEFDYSDVPGKITVADGTRIDKTTYDWKSMVGEYQYRFFEGDHSYYSVLLGIQDHQMPFLSVNGDGSVSLFENQLQNGSVGLKINYFGESDFEYEAFLRYQTVLSSKSMNGDDFSAHPNLMFDGSLGLSKKFNNGLKAGLFWFGQYQDIKYDFTRSGVTNSGTQNFFNSNIQFRLGWEFYNLITLLAIPASRRRRRLRFARFWKRKKRSIPAPTKKVTSVS